jgi:hypothetical protein
MKFHRIIKTKILLLLTISLVVLIFYQCNQDNSLNVVQDYSGLNSGTLGKKNEATTYPQFGSCKIKYFSTWDAYDRGLINIPNGSEFAFLDGALTPPQGHPAGKKVTITMRVDKDSLKQQLIFTFEPSGCQFNPAASFWIFWNDLYGSGVPNFYMIDDNGDYHLRATEEVNLVEKQMRVSIHHFSRYAVAFSQ